MKKTYLIKTKKKTYKYIFVSGNFLIDLSENIYNKLNDFKFDYKVIFSSIFEDKDDNYTNKHLRESESENKYVNLMVSWLLTLFGYEEELVLELSNSNELSKSQAIRNIYTSRKLELNILFLLITSSLWYLISRQLLI